MNVESTVDGIIGLVWKRGLNLVNQLKYLSKNLFLSKKLADKREYKILELSEISLGKLSMLPTMSLSKIRKVTLGSMFKEATMECSSSNSWKKDGGGI